MIAAASGGCSTLVGPSAGLETSRAAEPPAAWESAVLFQFRDAVTNPDAGFKARVEFTGEPSGRPVTGRDVYLTESNFLRTPWYRLRIPGAEAERSLVITVVLEHDAGGRTTAEYPLTVARDEFYYVSFGVATREPPAPANPDIVRELRSYPIPAAARKQPGDSLWIGYATRSRYCFACPG
jgi:hypothetical protein